MYQYLHDEMIKKDENDYYEYDENENENARIRMQTRYNCINFNLFIIKLN